MSQKHEISKKKPSNKGISIMKAIDRFYEDEERKNKGIGSSSSANEEDALSGSSLGEFLVGKKFVTKVKAVKKRHAQKHDSNSKLMKKWVTYINFRGWI